MEEIRYSSSQDFERAVFETAGLFSQPIPSQSLPADTTYTDNSGKTCI